MSAKETKPFEVNEFLTGDRELASLGMILAKSLMADDNNWSIFKANWDSNI